MSKASIQRVRDIANYLLEDVFEFGVILTNDEVFFLGQNDETLDITPDKDVLEFFVKAFNEKIDELERTLSSWENHAEQEGGIEQ